MKKSILIILDGWGLREEKEFNAIKTANTPNFDFLWENFPHTKLQASGEFVGLPDGQMGNSEVGHTNIGAGRVVYQDLTKINKAIKTGEIMNNPVLLELAKKTNEKNGDIHLMGLVSNGGVHSSMEHLFALLKFMKKNAKGKVFLHAFLDGRDTPPQSAVKYLKEVEEFMQKEEVGSIASISGRFYAMDRDNRWERVEKAYNALVLGKGKVANSVSNAIENAYKNDETDEFVLPTIILENGKFKGILKDNDSVVFFNFRSDRARELSMALNFDDFDGFKREKRINFTTYATMTEYREDFTFPVIYGKEELKRIFGEEISGQKLRQLRIAETEKYAHVTFFFNGGREEAFENEDRILVPSPKVETYDLKPEMSAFEVKDKLLENIEKYDMVILNFANTDMVGHTGVFEAAVKAVEAVDQCLGEIFEKIKKEGRIMFVTADHGNAELMFDKEKNSPHTAHTTNPVPFIVVNGPKDLKLNEGKLADIAPTIMKISDMEIPEEMGGKPLF